MITNLLVEMQTISQVLFVRRNPRKLLRVMEQLSQLQQQMASARQKTTGMLVILKRQRLRMFPKSNYVMFCNNSNFTHDQMLTILIMTISLYKFYKDHYGVNLYLSNNVKDLTGSVILLSVKKNSRTISRTEDKNSLGV